MRSPELRMMIGTIGTPACMAMWKAPFLKGRRRGVAVRVPSGAIAKEMPCFSMSTTGFRASRALALFARST